MGDPKGFLRIDRPFPGDPLRDPADRVGDYHEIIRLLPIVEVEEQATRCMQCAVPFCHSGCPLSNLIPEWNELVEQGRWREAIDRLHATNNFPEFTGLTCPAPCEPACTLEINAEPVMIKHIELSIIEKAFQEGWVQPETVDHRSGHRVAVVGSGPAGLAAAEQLNRAGHRVTVFERDEAPGGLLRFGIPDFKLEKEIVERRVRVMEASGIDIRCGVDVGVDITAEALRADHDAVVIAVGARLHRELNVPGAKHEGVHLAMDYLYDRNRAIASRSNGQRHEGAITAAGKHVVVIGGGDTGADCIANSLREGAASVTQLDRYPHPEGTRPREIVGWPDQPRRYPSTYALDEGATKRTAITHEIVGDGQRITGVRISDTSGPPDFGPIPGTEQVLPADLVLVAIGFERPARDAFLQQLDLPEDDRGNVRADDFRTSAPDVFACGDARMGQSIVVHAINEGRLCASSVDRFLVGEASTLPSG
ncbi:glutamate synthase subunit beta [Egibacter rhizosphaerae]|uniref:Glutamate synthase subunit beta n=1 Tax=Egibacter rhizosphaerae TaxID=1670831 RepID=A0A411YKX4_9ACTN|nr:glutamate synthase subunit beta [Egibacter rhizosphaerae]QBI21820.1 glutamate synthase subunit beta [Egibacter rhizosphaerae]